MRRYAEFASLIFIMYQPIAFGLFCNKLSKMSSRQGIRFSQLSETEVRPFNTTEQRKKRVLSGVQPTGGLHLGNYLGAIRQWVANQELFDNYFCVVDLHAITVPHDPKKLSINTLESAAMYLAAGIDPSKSSIFVQSHVRAHAELTWLFNCITPMNWLERMIQYKEKALKQGENVGVGLFDYPVLMAADILLYQADLVKSPHTVCCLLLLVLVVV